MKTRMGVNARLQEEQKRAQTRINDLVKAVSELLKEKQATYIEMADVIANLMINFHTNVIGTLNKQADTVKKLQEPKGGAKEPKI